MEEKDMGSSAFKRSCQTKLRHKEKNNGGFRLVGQFQSK